MVVGTADKNLGVDLVFSAETKPKLLKMVFVAGGQRKEFTVKKHNKDTGPSKFAWKAGTQGFVLALLDYKVNYKVDDQKQPGFYEYRGSRTRSPAAAACGVIEKQLWFEGVFGTDTDTKMEIAPQVFKVRKPAAEENIALQIDAELLWPARIHVYVGQGKELSRSEILKLTRQIQWKSHRRQKKPTIRAETQFHFPSAKAPGLPKEINETWLATQASDEAARIAILRDKVMAYILISRACATMSLVGLSRECVTQARLQADSFPDEGERFRLYAYVGEAQAQVGDIEGALATANGLYLHFRAKETYQDDKAKRRYDRGYLGSKALGPEVNRRGPSESGADGRVSAEPTTTETACGG